MKKTIYCVYCKQKVMQYDGKGSINLSAKCHNCNKLIVYNIATDEVNAIEVPIRHSSSSLRFW